MGSILICIGVILYVSHNLRLLDGASRSIFLVGFQNMKFVAPTSCRCQLVGGANFVFSRRVEKNERAKAGRCRRRAAPHPSPAPGYGKRTEKCRQGVDQYRHRHIGRKCIEPSVKSRHRTTYADPHISRKLSLPAFQRGIGRYAYCPCVRARLVRKLLYQYMARYL
eukprot:COSAG02_NODE_411_length_22864_cov_6.757523_3_plen_166_part_00